MKIHVTAALLCVLALPLLMGCPQESSQKLVFVPSHGDVIFVDPANPGEFASAPSATVQQKSGNITWNVTFADVDSNTNVGFDDPITGATRRTVALQVLDYIETVLHVSNNSTIDVQFNGSQTDGSGFLANAGTFYFQVAGYTGGIAMQHLNTGSDPVIGLIDIQCTVDFGFNYYTGSGTPTGVQYDLFTVLLHEMTHGLGFSSLADQNGASTIFTNAYSTYDKYIETGNGFDLWDDNDTETPDFLGDATDLTGQDGGLVFVGPNSVSTFGGSPPLYAPNPYVSGSSVSHWDTGNIPGGAVMEHAIFSGTTRRQYSALDIACLVDIGYANAAAVLPKADFSSSTYSVAEDTGTITITVNLDTAPGTGNSASVDYAATAGTASAGSDFTAVSNTLTFSDSETSKTFSVPIIADGNIEGDETVILTLSNPQNCELAGVNNPATLTILNDDVASAEVWVDFAYTGTEMGTSSQPFNTLAEALAKVTSGGTIKIKSDTAVSISPEILVVNQNVRIVIFPASGSVRIGVSGVKALWTYSGAYGPSSEYYAALSALLGGGLPVAQPLALNDGEDGASGGLFHESALPITEDAAGQRVAAPGTPVALRLHGDTPIASESLWATAPAGLAGSVYWQPADSALDDLWVILPDNGGLGALNFAASAGAAQNSAGFVYENTGNADTLWQPAAGVDYAGDTAQAAEPVTIALPGPALAGAVTEPVLITPESAYAAPRQVWLPIPADVDPATLRVYYGHLEGGAVTWMPAGQVAAWRVPGSYQLLDLPEGRYLGLQVRHAGIVQVATE